MEPERSAASPENDAMAMFLTGWRTAFVLGLITFVLGIIVIFRPTQSLVAIAILLGIAMIVSGVFHVVRALDGRENERVWRGIVGVLFVLAGIALLRHLHLTVALIGLFIGFTWIVQGIGSLVESFTGGRSRGESVWSLVFGIISLIAGVVVVAAPIASVTALTVFMGAWFIVMGAMEMLGSLVFRRAVTRRETRQVSIPGQRADAAGEAPAEHGAGRGAAAGPRAGEP